MASHISSRSWLLRDMRRAYVLLVLVAFVASFLSYFVDWSEKREAAMSSQPNNTDKDNGERRYTGSIFIPTRGNLCRELMLDNRTGKMRDNGTVKCDEATPQFTTKNSPEGLDMMRLRAVGNAFRHQQN